MNPFLLPDTRKELLEKLSAKSAAPHGAMGGQMFKGPEIDAEQAWLSCRQTPGMRHVLYVHVPFCVARCAFCGFYSNKCDDATMEDYTNLLIREMKREADRKVFTEPISVVFFGGGTPTALSAKCLYRVIRFLYDNFPLTDDVEFTIEGRIYAFDDDRVKACIDAGANRFSFGIQSFQTHIRQSMGRRNTREEILSRLARIRDIAGDKTALVADLIYGFPNQDQEAWIDENIRIAHEESVLDGMDLYSLKVFPTAPIAKMMTAGHGNVNWGEEERIMRHASGCQWLADHGWTQISNKHWRRSPVERNRYNTWVPEGSDMIQFGGGAGGSLGEYSFMQSNDLDFYRGKVEAGLKPIAMCSKRPANDDPRMQKFGKITLGTFDTGDFPEIDFSELAANWTAAGVWMPYGKGVYRLTRTGEYYEPKLSSLLRGFVFSGMGNR